MTDTRVRIPVATADSAIRELMAVREIVHAFLAAGCPQDVFQFALERVSPLVGATLACVYLLDGDGDVMHLAAAYNWPERFRPFLGTMRVRLGLGPSGQAADERRPIQVPDVFADEALADWQEVARELGFRALVALPLETPTRVLGAVAFYFAEAGGFDAEEDGLLRIVADQMAATAEKASLIHELRRTNAALMESNAELERQYCAALEARQLKDEFLANISHELRTPLTAVLGYAHLLHDGLSGPLMPEQRNTIAQVVSASERLLSLIDDLLELTALKSGGFEVTTEELDPREVLREATDATLGRAPGVTLRVESPEGMVPRMRSDRNKLVKILRRLLANAYKFTASGEVCASLEVADGAARFIVRDTGIGIAREAQQLVFEEFRQVDGSTTRRYGGSGLGLALAKQLARLLGGDIELYSAPNEGSAFTMTVPLEYGPELRGGGEGRPADDLFQMTEHS
ncbi:MAG TPA: GAF domain-containing sensor histidine kinase [Gemmatimonadaceae bacterium]|nr:GAF domain-containing sensor histidine kinase [Gemmatimonadaceae bacterium]